MTKIEKIEACLKDLETNKDLLKLLKMGDFLSYIKKRKLDWLMEDIGRSQKYDIVISIQKHNPKYIKTLKEEK